MAVDGLYQEMISGVDESATGLPLFRIHGHQTAHANSSAAFITPESKGWVHHRVDIFQCAVERHSLGVRNDIDDVLGDIRGVRIGTPNDDLDIPLKFI
jgi:hypothetical protein